MEPSWSDGPVTVYSGDCLEVLAAMEASSVDAVVTDPPYGLEFMGREWDSFKPPNARIRQSSERDRQPGAAHNMSTSLVTRNVPDAYVAGKSFQTWCEAWARECYRALKPGGHLLAFGGTRTYHRLVCGIEDAGFEIRDSLHWVYGSGFPKSLDVSKAIDKAAGAEREVVGIRPQFPDGTRGARARPNASPEVYGDRAGLPGEVPVTAPATEQAARWEGWGTALKPAHEPIAVARKPLAGTVAQNVLQYGTGALNVDGCRVAHASAADRAESEGKNRHADFGSGPRQHNGVYQGQPAADRAQYDGSDGRWPPNILLTHSADCNGDCAPACPVAELDRQSGVRPGFSGGGTRGAGFRSEYVNGENLDRTLPAQTFNDSGGASRFFPVFRYQAKAPASERPKLPDGTAWPTVKPLDLMRWLVRLVTPPGGTVLDCFGGTGTTAEACTLEGFRCVLIERDPVALELIKARLDKPVPAGQNTLF